MILFKRRYTRFNEIELANKKCYRNISAGLITKLSTGRLSATYLLVIADRLIDFLHVIDIGQNDSASAGSRGADHDVATAEELLDQSLRVTYALNLVPAEGVVEADQNPTFAGYALSADRVKLILSKQDDVENSDSDR